MQEEELAGLTPLEWIASEAATAKLHAAASTGDLAALESLLGAGVPAHAQNEADGVSALMVAAGAGHLNAVSILLAAGAPWNAVDRRGRCAGNHALDNGHQTIVDFLVDAATRAELLLGAAERASSRAAAAKAAESDEYLSRSVRYEGETLFDAADDAVMMEWERPLMAAHAERLCATGGAVMNVGFGMGIIDGLIAERKPSAHFIIEAHPGVLARMKADGWHNRPNVTVLSGRWQDVLPGLLESGQKFDGIFFDTYGEHDADMQSFHAALPKLLAPDGLYSFFNGMCPFNVFFQGVACAVVQLELQALGLSTAFEAIEINTPQGDDKAWEGVRRTYFHNNTYYLPHAIFDGGTNTPIHGAAAAADGMADVAMEDGDDDEQAGDGGAAATLINMNRGVVRLIAHSLVAAAAAASSRGAGKSKGAKSPEEIANLEGAAAMRSLLSEEILPHFEEAGWRLTAPLKTLWAAAATMKPPNAVPKSFIESYLTSRVEYDLSCQTSDAERLATERGAAMASALAKAAERGIDGSVCDANSAMVVSEAVRSAMDTLRGVGFRAAMAAQPEDEELRLAILTNPLADGDDDEDDEAALAADIAADQAAMSMQDVQMAIDGGKDSDDKHFGSADEFHSVTKRDEWYAGSTSYWNGVQADVDGMLGGLGGLHDPDIAGSLQFIDHLRSLSPALGNGVALDCGAGIGRVSRSVLLHRFTSVELLEPSSDFLTTAKQKLPSDRVGAYHRVGLQDFVPSPATRYAVVWIQWVLNYLTDDDLVAFLIRCKNSLQPNGGTRLQPYTPYSSPPS